MSGKFALSLELAANIERTVWDATRAPYDGPPAYHHPRPLEVIISISWRVSRHRYHRAPVFFQLLTGSVRVQRAITSRRDDPANREPSRRPRVLSSPSSVPPSGTNLRTAYRLASRSRARLLQMVEQRDD